MVEEEGRPKNSCLDVHNRRSSDNSHCCCREVQGLSNDLPENGSMLPVSDLSLFSNEKAVFQFKIMSTTGILGNHLCRGPIAKCERRDQT